MSVPQLPYPTLVAAAQALERGEATAVSLTDALLARIEAINPKLDAVTDVLAATARREAQRSDARRAAGKSLGPLDGVPILIKDIVDTPPAICSAGLPFLRDYRPKEPAIVVRRLRDAGAVILGVTASDPGAFGTRTAAVTHPQDPTLSVGGSSGGSGSALAAGLGFAALGTDTGGSIRIPAACCAVAGFKPTRGRVSTKGVRPLVGSLDHVGPLARGVADLAAVQALLDPRYRHTAAPGRHRAVGHDPAWLEEADPRIRDAIVRVLAACRDLGYAIREVRLPRPSEYVATHRVIFCSESAAYHFATFPDRLEEYPETPRRIFAAARQHTGYDLVGAMRRRADMSAVVQALFDSVDFLVTPTLPALGARRDAATLPIGGKDVDFTLAMIRFTHLFNHAGNPVVALPTAALAPGIAASAQIVGPLDRDAAVLGFAQQIEDALQVAIDYRIAA
jgi:aspartyl-tRNA(Asn)/glutamyl-tRNA(Gln) amidotransferase subunit A